MWAVPVVVMVPDGQRRAADFRRGIGTSVRPFAKSRLDEALGLAIGLRTIGSCEFLLDAECETRVPESERVKGWPVVGDQALHSHAELGKVGDGFPQEALSAVLALVRTHGREGNPSVIVEGDKQVFPTQALGSLGVIASDPVANI